MASNGKKLIRVTKNHARAAGKRVARAYYDDPLMVGLFPNDSERYQTLSHLYEFVIRFGVLYGEVYGTPKLEGVAVWLPSDNALLNPWKALMSGGMRLFRRIGTKNVMNLMLTHNVIHKRLVYHQRGNDIAMPHWYLALLGVDPKHQGKGHASNLLKAALTRIDQRHLPCYLETHSEETVPLFKHFGFKVLRETCVQVTQFTNWMIQDPSQPFTNTTNWMMARENFS